MNCLLKINMIKTVIKVLCCIENLRGIENQRMYTIILTLHHWSCFVSPLFHLFRLTGCQGGSPQHLLMRYGVHSIYSGEMESTAYTHDWRNPQHLHKRWNCCSPPVPCSPWWGWHRYWSSNFVSHSSSLVHSIFSWQVESNVFTHEIWSPQHWPPRDGIHSFHSREMEFIAFIHERWSTWHLLIRDGVHSIYSWEMEYTAFNHERWST